MPTSRAYSFLIGAAVLYLFANQTQVGWLYVMAVVLAGTVLAAWMPNRHSLRGIQGQRRFADSLTEDIFENDEITIGLILENTGRGSAAQVRALECCPLAAPDSPQRMTALFIPVLPAKRAVEFTYAVTVDRRGIHDFPPLALGCRAPFGFFAHKQTLPVATRILVYPEVRAPRRLDLLDRHFSAQVTRPRAGTGNEVIGIRPFRSGDSPRHIHWRSVARTGQLISKEFADEAQPGLTLALDVHKYPYPDSEGKHVPFEWAVKIAASIGEFARQRGYPLHLAIDPDALAAPTGPVAWSALLQFLARIQPTSKRPFSTMLSSQQMQTFVAVVIPWPDETILAQLVALSLRSEILAVVIDPKTFPRPGPSAGSLVDQIRAAGIETRLIKYESDWAHQLAEEEGNR